MRAAIGMGLLGALLASGPTVAQRAGALEISVLGVWHNKTTLVDGLRGFGGGTRLGIWLPAGFELEGQLDLTTLTNWAPPQSRFILLHYNASLLYNVRLAGGGTIYVRGGYGRLKASSACNHRGPCPIFGAATGALGFRVPLGGAANLRAEGMVRNRSIYDYTSFGASVGLSFVTGGRPGTADLVDTDRDGVPDRRDRCRGTALGALVDSRGCPTDHDGDGVVDGIDRCPTTPPGTDVNEFGCPRTPTPPAASRRHQR